jgi:carboxymethylenebutenolidase
VARIGRLSKGYPKMIPPVRETLIHTDAAGLVEGEVWVPAADGEIPAYRAAPAAGGPHPIVLVVQEVFGVDDYLKDTCRRLAKRGHLAIAPELYARQGEPTEATSREDLFKIVGRVSDAQVMGDLDACVAWAERNGGDPARLAITGFCWGGRAVWLYAAHSSKLKAGVAWYGRLAGDPPAKHPVDVAAALRAPVLGLYGAEDTGIPLDTVERMRAALAAAKSPSKIELFPGAPHGFHADYRPSYEPDAAERGWKLLLDWFAAYGVKA